MKRNWQRILATTFVGSATFILAAAADGSCYAAKRSFNYLAAPTLGLDETIKSAAEGCFFLVCRRSFADDQRILISDAEGNTSGEFLIEHQRFAEAKTFYMLQRQRAKIDGNTVGQISALERLSWISLQLKQFGEAESFLKRASALSHEVPDLSAALSIALGHVYNREKKQSNAMKSFLHVIEMYSLNEPTSNKAKKLFAEALEEYGTLLAQKRGYSEARSFLVRALDLYAELPEEEQAYKSLRRRYEDLEKASAESHN